MTRYELFRWITFWMMPTHMVTVRNDIKNLIKKIYPSKNKRLSILEVGGRKSPYTVNLDVDFTLLDVPQENHTQETLNLGFTDRTLNFIKSKRSNIKEVIVQDMTKSTLLDNSFDAVVCVEVIEHVVEDAKFVENISRVIKKGGWAYFTTPNGDFIKNEGPNMNPDHIRHYTKEQLSELLNTYFTEVEVHYAVKTGKYRVRGLKSYSIKKPLQLIKGITGNIINRFQSKGMERSKLNTAHLIAIAYK